MSAEIYEKLGVFYLGHNVDNDGEATKTPTLYESKDLTTHAAIIGMTGSGKTGLGIGLIEEAAIDGIPVIAIDPKGDLANLKLAFPKLTASDFEPWIDPMVASNKGKTVNEFAKDQAKLWKKGLKDSDQEGRIERLQAASETQIYTPGLSAGRPLSILGSLNAPNAALREDMDMYAERLEATASSILTLIGIDCDPLSSPEHILLSNILRHHWDKEENVQLAGLISSIQTPPISRIGVLDLESFYPSKERAKLAMRINGLLASPGFAAWLEGDKLAIDKLLYNSEGKSQVSVMYIAHLSDEERMFFVTIMLAELISWMRKQPGTGSLRAILYIDELFGYMPPNGNPPSKKLLLTLLKQARAFGVGVVLSTQNPVDLDYKGLSNCGTWLIGRLQTEQDRNRLLDGLDNGNISRSDMDKRLGQLAKRQFLLHNVHEEAPVVFNTRWAMSYLAGPASRQQVTQLCEKPNSPATSKASPKNNAAANQVSHEEPVIDSAIDVFFINPATGTGDVIYFPELVFEAEVAYFSKTYNIDDQIKFKRSVSINNPINFDEAIALDETLERKGISAAEYTDCPSEALNPKNYKKWQKELARWLRIDHPLELWQCKAVKLVSEIDESKEAFISRVQQAQRENRDLKVGKVRDRYESKLTTLNNRILRAEQKVEREEEQARDSKVNVALSIGSTLLGAFFGRKALSKTNISKASTAMRRASKVRKESNDIERAEEQLADLQLQLADLEQNFKTDIEVLEGETNNLPEISSIKVRAKSSDITIQQIGLLWKGE